MTDPVSLAPAPIVRYLRLMGFDRISYMRVTMFILALG